MQSGKKRRSDYIPSIDQYESFENVTRREKLLKYFLLFLGLGISLILLFLTLGFVAEI